MLNYAYVAFKAYRMIIAISLVLFSSHLMGQNFSLEFDCGDNVSIDAIAKGGIDSTTVTIQNVDIASIDSTLVEIVVKGDPINFQTVTVTTSGGEVVNIPFSGLVTNEGSDEEAAIYRAFVLPANTITVTNPSSAPLEEEEWQSVTIFNIRRNLICVGGSASLDGILLLNNCDSLVFNIEETTENKSVNVLAPISEFGDGLFGPLKIGYVAVDILRDGQILPGFSFFDTLKFEDIIAPHVLLYERFIENVPNDADQVVVVFISPGGPNGCISEFGDSFVVGTVAVSASCEPGVCCRLDAICMQDMGGNCNAVLPPIPPSLQDTVSGTDSIDFVNLGGFVTSTLCDSFHIRAFDQIMPSNCGPNSFNIDRTFQFYSQLGVIELECTVSVQDFILPVEFNHFVAEKLGQNEAILKWRTLQEINVNYFEVERSTDGQRFVSLGIIGAGTPVDSYKDYEFVDRSPLSGVNYYRLKVVDLDGSVTFSSIQNVSFDRPKGRYSIYPNPTNDDIIIKSLGHQSTDFTVLLYDSKGQQLLVNQSNDEIEIELPDIGDGMYYVQILDYLGQIVLTQSIVKIKGE